MEGKKNRYNIVESSILSDEFFSPMVPLERESHRAGTATMMARLDEIDMTSKGNMGAVNNAATTTPCGCVAGRVWQRDQCCQTNQTFNGIQNGNE